MRAARLLAVCALLAVAACGDDGDESTTTSTPTTAAPTTTTNGDASSTSSPPAQAPQAPAAGALVPEVVCLDFSNIIPDVAFAYLNESASAVVLPDGASTVTNALVNTPELTPHVFAPGRVSPAVWFSATEEDGVLPSWTVTGPDGVTRTATPDGATPECTPELVAPTTPDPRAPAVEVTAVTPSAGGSEVTVDFALTGVDDQSICPTGLEPEPVSVTWASDGAESEGFTARQTVALNEGGPTGVGFIVTVLDQCSSGGVVQPIWPGGSFEALFTGVGFCVLERDGELVAVEVGEDPECPELPLTGGSQVRPN